MEDESYSEELAAMPRLFGGVLCLDFANTIEPRGGPAPFSPPADQGATMHEYIRSYRDLVLWGLHTGVIEHTRAGALIAAAERQPDAAREVFARAIRLREVIYRLFYMLANGEQPNSEDLRYLSLEQREAMQHASLVPAEDGFAWTWEEETHLARVLWAVAFSATKLLLEGERERIKVCPGVPGFPVPCAWLFYDASKNRVRTWCSMSDCGGIVKARRQNERPRRSP